MYILTWIHDKMCWFLMYLCILSVSMFGIGIKKMFFKSSIWWRLSLDPAYTQSFTEWWVAAIKSLAMQTVLKLSVLVQHEHLWCLDNSNLLQCLHKVASHWVRFHYSVFQWDVTYHTWRICFKRVKAMFCREKKSLTTFDLKMTDMTVWENKPQKQSAICPNKNKRQDSA